MQKNCEKCRIQFTQSNEEIRLYKKFNVDPSNICFDCRQKHRLSFRNERVLYNRKCDATGEKIVSIYAPDKPYKVYNNDYWYGDSWDPMEYGRNFDFNRPFFEQFKELQMEVPRSPLVNLKSENSDYCNMCVGNKNCYLVFGGDLNEDCMYGTLCMHNKDSLDIDYSNHNELTYFMDNSMKCYACQYVWDSSNCSNCYFCSDCIGCNECIFSNNLKNKSYHIKNIKYSKEEYLQKKNEILNGSYKTQLENWRKFLEMRKKRMAKYSHIISCENCTGDYLKNNKNCQNCYDVSDSEDITNCIFASKAKDCFNNSLLGDNARLIYDCISAMETTNVKHSYFVLNGGHVEYSEQLVNCFDIFGCNGLRQKKYCILNKQYSKEDYENLREKIIDHMLKTGEWGKYFPKEFSCFGYNESTGMRYYPLTKEQALQQGFTWRDEDPKNYQKQSYQIPDKISDVPDSICREILACEACGKNFKIVPVELKFYIKQNIPVPHKCPECRQGDRNNLRNPPKLYNDKCIKCNEELQTTYVPGHTETLYCEKCYLDEVC